MTNIPVTTWSRLKLYCLRLFILALIPILSSYILQNSGSKSSYFPYPIQEHLYPGDSLIPNPDMFYNQHIIIFNTTASDIFPWLLQLGKGRAGWYLPSSWDNVISTVIWKKWEDEDGGGAAWQLEQRWIQPATIPGNQVQDYGFGTEPEWFEVKEVKQPDQKHIDDAWLVYQSYRNGCDFTWALYVWQHPAQSTSSVEETHDCTVHLRFRGKIQATGLKKKVIVWGGEMMDFLTTWPMLRGLRERIAMQQEMKDLHRD